MTTNSALAGLRRSIGRTGPVQDIVRLLTAVAVIVVIGEVVSGNALWTRIATSAVILYILVGSYNIIFGYAGLLSLAHVAIAGVGGYASAILGTKLDLTFWVVLPLAAVISMAVALLLAYPTTRLGGVFFALGTLVFAEAASEIEYSWTALTGGAQGVLGIDPPEFAGEYLFGGDPGYYWLAAILALLSFEVFFRISRSSVARRMVALRESLVATQAVGVNPRGVRILAFGVSGLFAGVAGVLLTHLTLYISPETFSLDIMIQALIVLLLGGSGTLLGPILGVIALVAIQESGELIGSASYLLFGVAVIAIIAFAPNGLVGVAGRLRKRWRRGKTAQRTVMPKVKIQLPSEQQGKPPVDLVVQGVSVEFAGVKALKNVSLSLRTGEVLGLIGPNGAGKTSVVNVVSGLVHPSAGSVTFGEEALLGRRPYEIARMGVVRTFQKAQLIPSLDLITNVMLGRNSYGRSRMIEQVLHLPRSRRDDREAHDMALGLLELMDIQEHATTVTADLPYGIVRRAEIARALALEPAFLLLDEPGAGLSSYERDEIAQAINAVAKRGVGCLLIDHNVEFVASVCQRLVVLANGEVLVEGETTTVLRHEGFVEAYLGGRTVR